MQAQKPDTRAIAHIAQSQSEIISITINHIRTTVTHALRRSSPSTSVIMQVSRTAAAASSVAAAPLGGSRSSGGGLSRPLALAPQARLLGGAAARPYTALAAVSRPYTALARAPAASSAAASPLLLQGGRGLGRRPRRSPAGPVRAAASSSDASSGGGGRRITQNEFTEKAWQAVVAAPEVATAASQQVVETEHLLKALLEQPNGLARRVVSKAGGDPTRLLERTDDYIRRQPRVTGDAAQQVLGRNLEGAVNRAMDLRQKMGDKFVSVEHLLLALADDARFAEPLLRQEGLAKPALERAVADVRGSNKVTDQDPEGKYEALSRYARDLTRDARDGRLDPVIGRDDEIRRAIQILSRRTKNNPVLIGEPGVGKTAVAEGLAQRIVAGDVPSALQGRTLMSLDMGALIAGAKYRGEFEDRLKSVIKEVTDSSGKIVLFIDGEFRVCLFERWWCCFIFSFAGFGFRSGSLSRALSLFPPASLSLAPFRSPVPRPAPALPPPPQTNLIPHTNEQTKKRKNKRNPHRRRRRRHGRRHGRQQPAQARPRARRAPLHRRHHPR